MSKGKSFNNFQNIFGLQNQKQVLFQANEAKFPLQIPLNIPSNIKN